MTHIKNKLCNVSNLDCVFEFQENVYATWPTQYRSELYLFPKSPSAPDSYPLADVIISKVVMPI